MKTLRLAYAIALLLWANYAFAAMSPYYGPGCGIGMQLTSRYDCDEVRNFEAYTDDGKPEDYPPIRLDESVVVPGRADPESRETLDARDRAYALAGMYGYVLNEDQGCGFGEGKGFTDEEYDGYADCLEYVHAEETLSPADFEAWKAQDGYVFEDGCTTDSECEALDDQA